MTKARSSSPAFTLVEVTLAIGIAAFAMIPLFGLLPVGVNSNQASVEQTVAAELSTALISDLRATTKTTPPTLQNSPRFGVGILATGSVTHTVFLKEDGSIAGAVDADASAATNPRYRATITLKSPAIVHKSATTARVLITWPALADSAVATTPSKYSGYFEATTALDRN